MEKIFKVTHFVEGLYKLTEIKIAMGANYYSFQILEYNSEKGYN